MYPHMYGNLYHLTSMCKNLFPFCIDIHTEQPKHYIGACLWYVYMYMYGCVYAYVYMLICVYIRMYVYVNESIFPNVSLLEICTQDTTA